jgi:hypothetical protein
MAKQIISIGIDSEIDRVDAIFNVATGPMGHQEINYHLIEAERDHRPVRQSLPYVQPINESSKEKTSSQLRTSPLQYRRTINSEILKDFQKDHGDCRF